MLQQLERGEPDDCLQNLPGQRRRLLVRLQPERSSVDDDALSNSIFYAGSERGRNNKHVACRVPGCLLASCGFMQVVCTERQQDDEAVAVRFIRRRTFHLSASGKIPFSFINFQQEKCSADSVRSLPNLFRRLTVQLH
jgi:hypothetical protein